jgi:iron complex outermembrane recepter protein
MAQPGRAIRTEQGGTILCCGLRPSPGGGGTPPPPFLCRVRATLAAAVLALCLAPAAPAADARVEAKKHFRSGMSLIAQGQTERGVAELKQAYAIKPHPDILYNIARAYLDDGNVREALVWFRKYAATNPKDRANVEAITARLAAATKPSEPTAQPQQNSIDAQKLLAQLQEMIVRNKAEQRAPEPAKPAAAKPAAAKAADVSADTFEPTAITAETRATAREIAAALGGHSDEAMFDDQPASAPARPPARGPTPSLAVVGEDEIRLSGAATIAELLKRLPGVGDDAGAARGNALVLVDGRSAYDELVGGTPWPLLDLALVDISRIEVVRGASLRLPGGAVIGSVVNIVTRAGDEHGRGTGQDARTVQAAIPTDSR